MGQAFSRVSVTFSRSDVIPCVYDILGGWEYDRICTAWAGFFTGSEEHTTADGTPSVFMADLAKFQRITSLSKKAAHQLAQVFNVCQHMKSLSQPRFTAFPAPRWVSTGSGEKEGLYPGKESFPMLEILVVAVVLGNMKRVTKLSLLFSLFSLNGVLSEAEFFFLCYFVFRGMAKAVRRPIPGYSFIEPLVVATLDELFNKKWTERNSCLRSISTASTDSAAPSTGSTGCLFSKRNSSIQDVSQKLYGRPGGTGVKRSSLSEMKIALARLEEAQEHNDVCQQRPSFCGRREMTLKDFLQLTLGRSSALDLIFKDISGDCPLTIAAHLDFTRSLQFQTNWFQNVFLVQQWLQTARASTDHPTGRYIRLTAAFSICLDLAEKSAEIVREIYSVIAADRRMALQGMVCVEVPACPANENPNPVENSAPQACPSSAVAQTAACLPPSTRQQASSILEVVSPSMSANGGSSSTALKQVRRIPAFVLASLLAEQHVRRQVCHWWPDLRIKTSLDDLPERRRIFRKLMDVFSSRLYGNLLCGASTLRCRITHTQTLHVKSIIQGGEQIPWIEVAVTQGLDTGRGPPVRVIAEADMMRVIAEEEAIGSGAEVCMELSNVRDNYYLVFVVKCRASDNEIVTVGRGAILLSTFAEEKTWVHTFIPIEPCHSAAVNFACENPQLGCSVFVETQRLKEAVECNPLRLNALNFYIQDVMCVEGCTLYLHFENGLHTNAGTSHGNTYKVPSAAISMGIVYRGKPVAGVIFFPFSESESVAGLTYYGCLKPQFWKNINETYIKLPAKPSFTTQRTSSSIQGKKKILDKERGNSAGAAVASSVQKPVKPSLLQHNKKSPFNSSNAANNVVKKRRENSRNSRMDEVPPSRATVHRGVGEGNTCQRRVYTSEITDTYSSTPSRSSVGSTRRENTSRKGPYTTGSACHSGFPLHIHQNRTQLYRQTQLPRLRCGLPSGNLPVPLRLLRPQEFFFENSSRTAEATVLAFSTEDEKERLQTFLKDPRACSMISCRSGLPAKTSCIGRVPYATCSRC